MKRLKNNTMAIYPIFKALILKTLAKRIQITYPYTDANMEILINSKIKWKYEATWSGIFRMTCLTDNI